jgi:hypothetical protein
MIAEGGASINVRDVYNWSRQDINFHKIKSNEMAELWSLVRNLPEEEKDVPRDRLLTVKYKDGDEWVYKTDIIPIRN